MSISLSSDRSSMDRLGLLQEKRKYSSELDAERSMLPSSYSADGGPACTGPRSVLLYVSLMFNFILATLCGTWLFALSTTTSTPLTPNDPSSSSSSWAQLAPQDVYSPAEDAIRYETVVFRTGFRGERSEYQGGSAAADAAWESLYNAFGISQVDGAAARRLPNATAPLDYDPAAHVVQLDVFHQLHCLNMLRKRLYPARHAADWQADPADALYHAEHCVESLRQSLMCAADVSTIYWEWSAENEKMMGNTATTHVCRNFDSIRDWAIQHRLRADPDWLQYVEGAPLRDDSKDKMSD